LGQGGRLKASTIRDHDATFASTQTINLTKPQPVLQTFGVQPKLAIGAVDDPLEHEADRAADQVMRMADPELSIAAAPQQLSRKCAACEEDKTQRLQTSPQGTGQRPTSEAPELVSEALRSPGRPLDPPTRALMESRLRHDFAEVRIHNDTQAWASARAIGALAYTVGNNVVFGECQYRPDSKIGMRLIAHELTHTIQQRSIAPLTGPVVMCQAQGAQPQFGATCSGGANDPCQAARCTPNQRTTALGDIARAIRYVNAAIAALSATPLASDTTRALRWLFTTNEQATADEVKRRLGCILDCLTDTQTNNRFACDPPDSNLAYVCVGPTSVCTQALVDVCLTDKHFASDDRERAETVIHECAHRVGMSLGSPTSVPDIYRFTPRFLNLSTTEALRNSDSYALFASSITEGIQLSVLPLVSLDGRGGRGSWSGRRRHGWPACTEESSSSIRR
jgi:hypothetical protein